MANITNDWGGGYCASVVVTNNGSSAVNGWTVSLTVAGTVSSMWNGTWTQSGTTLTVTGVSWNSSLQAGASDSSIGFCATR